MNWITFLQPIIQLVLETILGIGGVIASAYIYKRWGIVVDKNNLDKAVHNAAKVEEFFASGKGPAGLTKAETSKAKDVMAVNLQMVDTGKSQVESQKDVDTAVAISPNIGATSVLKQPFDPCKQG